MTTARQVADQFKAVVREWLTADELLEVDQRNRRTADAGCATHDFCDANMAMLEALGRVLPERTEDDLCDELCSGGPLASVVDDGWALAKIEGFSAR